MELLVRNGDLQFNDDLLVTDDLVYRLLLLLHNLFLTERGELALMPEFGIDRYQLFDYVHGVRPSLLLPYVNKMIGDLLQKLVSGSLMMNIELTPDDLRGILNVKITFNYFGQEFEIMNLNILVELNDVKSLISFNQSA